MKLYRYRPNNEFLFKELLYREIYLASPMELNDPLDLNGKLNFFTSNDNEIKSLVNFLTRNAFVAFSNIDFLKEVSSIIHFNNFCIFLKTEFQKFTKEIVTKSDLYKLIEKYLLNHKTLKLCTYFSCLDNVFSEFLKNSSAACFTECPNDFLMWSHYASGHHGVCLEFTLDEEPQDKNILKIPLQFIAPIGGEIIEFSETISKVQYVDDLSRLCFYEYGPIFHNSGDIDLHELSKSKWHYFADKMKPIFTQKLYPWNSEKEWRIVNISFTKKMPESRIIHYKKSCLTGVYFGANISEEAKLRIQNIVEHSEGPIFYQCSVNGTQGVTIQKA